MKFGIIGYGNLGKAVAAALVCTGDASPRDVRVCDSSDEALSLAEKEHYRVCRPEDINSLVSDADVICLVVKSYVFEQLARTIDKKALGGKLVISFMAGVTIERLSALLEHTHIPDDAQNSRTGEGVTFSKPQIADGSAPWLDSSRPVHIALAMPSLAIAKNDGIIAYTKLPDEVAAIFGKFGFAFETEPENIGKVTAFSSCGLGFAAYLIDAFKAAGEKLGFPPGIACKIAAKTFENACVAGNFSDTVKAVATPGGVTEQGIKHMDACATYSIISEAMQKAYDKVK